MKHSYHLRHRLSLCEPMLSMTSCGFLLTGGIIYAARAVGWGMAALGGGAAGLLGASAFAVGCAMVYCLRQRGGAADVSADWLTLTAWVIMLGVSGGREKAAESVLAAAALLAHAGKRLYPCRWLMLPAAMLPCVLPPDFGGVGAETLCALLASAGMCGSAAYRLTENKSKEILPWLCLGGALGLLDV